MNGWVIFLIVLVVIAILAVVGYFVYKARREKIAGGLNETAENSGALTYGTKHNNV